MAVDLEKLLRPVDNPALPFPPKCMTLASGEIMVVRQVGREEIPNILPHIEPLIHVERDYYDIVAARLYAELLGFYRHRVQDEYVLVAQIDGEPLPNAPEYNVNFTARYDMPVGADGKLFLATDWNVQGYTSFVLYKSKEFNSDGNFEGGLKLGYESAKGYEVALFGRNITNEKNLKGVIENYMAAVYNEPRIIGLSISAKLN